MSITLKANDSINLTTGVVTRCDVADLPSQTANGLDHSDRLRIRNLRGLHQNYLVALWLVILGDESIPACSLTGVAMPEFKIQGGYDGWKIDSQV